MFRYFGLCIGLAGLCACSSARPTIGRSHTLPQVSAATYGKSLGRPTIGRSTQEQDIITSLESWLKSKEIEVYGDNKVDIFPTGAQKFARLQEDIATAQHYIHMEYFNFRNDSISHRLFTQLIDKSKQGVEVRILFDAFGNASNNRPLKKNALDSLRQLGLNIVKFDPIRFPYINHVLHRDHRKLVSIDGRIGYTGGMNVADYYINGLEGVGAWRDMHMRIEGSACHALDLIFADMWQSSTEEDITHTLAQYTADSLHATEPYKLAIIDRRPRTSPSAIRDLYYNGIDAAQERIRIINPYFVPTAGLMRRLSKAISRGVKVEILMSERSDIPLTPDVAKHKLRKLARRGAQVHLYKEGFHHSKIMTIDGKISTIGSANLNSRSLRYDYEINALLLDSIPTQQLDSIIDADQSESIPLDDAYWKRRSKWKRFVGWLANLLTPFL